MTFVCKENCGKCCGPVPMTPAFISLNRDKIQNTNYTLTPAKFMKRVSGGREVYALTKNLECIFLTQEKKCAIYDIRPYVCRIYGVDKRLPCPFIDLEGKLREKPISELLDK